MKTTSAKLWHQVDRAGLLDRIVDYAMQFSGYTCHATWKNFSSFGSKFAEDFRIRRDQLLDRNILSTAGHLAVSHTKIDAALYGLWLGHDN